MILSKIYQKMMRLEDIEPKDVKFALAIYRNKKDQGNTNYP